MKQNTLYQFETNTLLDILLMSIGVLEDKIDEKLGMLLYRISKNSIVVNIVMVLLLLSMSIFLWKKTVQGLEERILKARKVLELFPLNILNTNSRVKKFLNDTCDEILIN